MQIRFIDPDGCEHIVEGEPGDSVMQCATHHLIPGIIGECGGSMACATCHGYVVGDGQDVLPPPSQLERDMLEGCIDTQPNSRLTCQIVLNEGMEGLTIRIPKSQT